MPRVSNWAYVNYKGMSGLNSEGVMTRVTLFFVFLESSDLRFHDAAFTLTLLLKKLKVLWIGRSHYMMLFHK